MKRPNTVIILEGPDGAGKTALAEQLVRDDLFQRWHEGVPPPGRDQLKYYAGALFKALRAKKPVVFDRAHLGELVYGPIARNHDALGYFGARLLNRICHAHGVSVYVCLPPLVTVIENWRQKFTTGDDYVRSEKKIIDVYYRFKALSVYHQTFDYTQEYNQQLYDLRNRLEEPRSVFPLNSLGRPTAKFLIVGERPGDPKGLDSCFLGTDKSSGFINQALWDAGYHERELFFINAFDIKGKPNPIDDVIRSLPNLKAAIALGKEADRAVIRAWPTNTDRNALRCTEGGCPELFEVESINHPQHQKRFFNGKRQEYVQKLKEIRSRYAD